MAQDFSLGVHHENIGRTAPRLGGNGFMAGEGMSERGARFFRHNIEMFTHRAENSCADEPETWQGRRPRLSQGVRHPHM